MGPNTNNMKKTANIYHHTHWDNEWYFTEEDSLIQLSYHMKELLYALEQHIIEYFYLDGQTSILEDYLDLHPEDAKRVSDLIRAKRLFVGPFHTQLDSFITSGESIINNLRYGIQYANKQGGASLIAYLPDSFGQSQDFPKIFNQVGIHHFVFRRGMGDEHQLPLDFIYRSNEGSETIVTTLYCGYGFATEPFISQTLTKDAGLDYDGKDIKKQLETLAELSTLENDFLLPIGNDQTPVIWNFKELLASYQEDERYNFEEVTLMDYMQKLKQNKAHLKVYEGEFINPQYHRVHRSIYSARMDIKIIQDRIERLVALEIQPMMTILDHLGFAYDENIIQRIWNLLARSQTHSAATNTDKTNELILKRSERSLNLAEALKVYLVRKVALSISSNHSPLVVFNTFPYKRDMIVELEIYTKQPTFILKRNQENLSFTIFRQEKEYGGTVRKDERNHNPERYFYKSVIVVEMKDVPGLSYQTIYIEETENEIKQKDTLSETIENEYYSILFDGEGVHLHVKESNETISQFVYLEESGDEGDNYDYSYPSEDMILYDYFKEAVYEVETSNVRSHIIMKGTMRYPKDLQTRKEKLLNCEDSYEMRITLDKGSKTIGIKGTIHNTANNHRMRIVSKTKTKSNVSIAGTQFGFIQRESAPELMKTWKKEGWLEEPSPIYPLLNYVALEKEDQKHLIFTKSSKEYEIIGDNLNDIAITIFRSVGYLGLPDLNRRPGRASGLAERLIPSPLSQMIGDNSFEIGILVDPSIDYNEVVQQYNEYAVSEIYYQKQNMNRVVYPISYFETNPFVFEIPDQYQLPCLEEGLPFSTLEKINDAYLLRVFHNLETIELDQEMDKFDMFANKIESSKSIRFGEIVNKKIPS